MADQPLKCLVEIPKGSRNKYEYDHEQEVIRLDGDPLDAMVCVSEPTFPGCMIDVKPIALFRMEDDKGIDDKVLCVPLQDPAWNTLEELDDLSGALRDEIAHFFSVYKDLEQKKVKVDGWYSREDALKEIEAARERHRRDGGQDGGGG